MSVSVVLDNVRSLYNVGAVMRACDGAGVFHVITCGITPYPDQGATDARRGPVAARADRELRKTALAAIDTVRVEPYATAADAIAHLKAEGATIVAVEAVPGALPYWESPALEAPDLALVFGHEVEGLSEAMLALVDAVVRLPMLGAGKSLNIATAAAVILYELVRRRSAASLHG